MATATKTTDLNDTQLTGLRAINNGATEIDGRTLRALRKRELVHQTKVALTAKGKKLV